MSIARVSMILALVSLIAACGRSGTTTITTAAPEWIVVEAPTGDVSVSHAKAQAAEGETIVIRGRIGGRRDPISTDAATFILVDVAIPSCDQIPGDNCPTPWDYCCEPSESMMAGTAAVQIVDETGHVRHVDLKKFGIKPLDTVIVTGTVAARPNPQTLVIKGHTLHRATP